MKSVAVKWTRIGYNKELFQIQGANPGVSRERQLDGLALAIGLSESTEYQTLAKTNVVSTFIYAPMFPKIIILLAFYFIFIFNYYFCLIR
jgi:hypothetical protein